VSLYAGGTNATLTLTELTKNGYVMVPLVAFILAAACAGTLLGNLSRFGSERDLNVSRMKIFGCVPFPSGKWLRILEKVFFWIAAQKIATAAEPVTMAMAARARRRSDKPHARSWQSITVTAKFGAIDPRPRLTDAVPFMVESGRGFRGKARRPNGQSRLAARKHDG
jgi:hypothetical protein